MGKHHYENRGSTKKVFMGFDGTNASQTISYASILIKKGDSYKASAEKSVRHIACDDAFVKP